MTKKEAIKWIERIKEKYIHGGDEGFDDARRRALDMAIEALKDRPSEYNTISIANEPYTTEYAKGYNDAKREIALSGEYERVYQRGKADAIEALQTDIVRCKDCKWYGHLGCAIRIVDDSDKPNDNDFCSFGERREE